MRILAVIGGLMGLVAILFGTWPIVFGKPPVKPIVKPADVEKAKDAIADKVKGFSLD